jgi:HEAT repeat protein
LLAGVALGVLLAFGCASDGGETRPIAPAADGRETDDARPGPVRPIDRYDDPVVRSLLREAAIARLEEAAQSESALLRANAVEGLAGAPSRGGAVAAELIDDENPGVRFAAIMTVGDLRTRGVAERLRQRLEDRDERVAMAAVYALTRLGVDVNQTLLAEGLRAEQLGVRSTAAFVLGEIGNASAAPMLREAQRRVTLRTPSAPRGNVERALFRLQVAEALIKLGDAGADSVVRSALYPGYREEVEAAVLAAQIIGELKLESGVSQLVRIIEQPAPGDTTDTPVRERSFLWPRELRLAAARSLAQMDEFGGVFVADLCFDAPEATVRHQAAFVYGEAGRPRDLAKLELMLADPDPLVRVAAASAVLLALGG